MKVLILGDPHGKLPKNLKSIIKKRKVDIILCTGDFFDFSPLRHYVFKYWDKIEGHSEELRDIIGTKKFGKLVKKINKSGEKVLRELNKLGVPVLAVYGNIDSSAKAPYGKTKGKESIEGFAKSLKNVTFLDYKAKKVRGYTIYGIGCKFSSKGKKLLGMDKKMKEKIRREEQAKLKKFFKKANPEKTILLTHEPPKSVLDKITNKKSPRYGEHVGDDITKKFIRQYQPFLHICGHIHEAKGKAKIGKTTVINAGQRSWKVLELKEK